MTNYKKIQFFDKDQTSIIEVDSYYEDYYIKKGFKKLGSKLSKYIYLKFLRFPKLLFKLIKNSKIIFNNPAQKDYVIYDDINTQYIKMILHERSFFILASRIERIKELYITKSGVFEKFIKNL